MRFDLCRGARAGQLSWLLLLALLPMLTFMGHWPTTLPIPGTDSFVAIPLAGAAREDAASAHGHAQHCHGDAENCSDAPAAGGVSVALGNEALALSLAGGLLVLAAGMAWRPSRWVTVGPSARPPEGAGTAAGCSLDRTSGVPAGAV